MKIVLSCLAALLFITAQAQTDSASKVAKFKSVTYSFGKIKQHVPATTEFSFTNIGTKPLIIETAVAECGCTTPDYPKAPLAKDKTASIKVTYNAENPGKFTKRVTVKFANIAQPVILTIEGDVEPAKS
jgi:hypothetical protein